MVRAIKQIVTIQPGGRVEVTSEQLPAGDQAEVIVLLNQSGVPTDLGDNSKLDTPARPIWEVADDLMRDIPEDELAKLPADLAAEHDHYLYGSPKLYFAFE